MDQITLFRSLFKGRDDVFAIRWKKENKSGYSPAYSYDPYYYKRHRMAGGTFQNYTDKSHLPLSDGEIIKHLDGQQRHSINRLNRSIAAPYLGKVSPPFMYRRSLENQQSEKYFSHIAKR